MTPVLEVRNLSTRIALADSVVRAVGNVDLHVGRGETLGLVGESGCGKSMTALSVMGLLPPGGAITGGSIRLGGRELVGLPRNELRKLRGNEVAMIFQDPLTSLDPTKTIGYQVAEPVRQHRGASRAAALDRAAEVLALAGLPRPRERMSDYPHQLSGGLRQRVMIAMALACEPRLLIADEPTTALDVTIQAQILALLRDLRERLGMAMLLITHDMGVIAGHADRVAVMYAGRVVETAAAGPLFQAMRHPYTQGLLGSIPRLGRGGDRALHVIGGMPPDLAHPPAGCRFAARCEWATSKCRDAEPPLTGQAGGHQFSCWHPVEGPLPLAGLVDEGAGLEGPVDEGSVVAGAGPKGAVVEGPVAEGPVVGGSVAERAGLEGAVAEGPVAERPVVGGSVVEGAGLAGAGLEGAVAEGPVAERPVVGGSVVEGAGLAGALLVGPVAGSGGGRLEVSERVARPPAAGGGPEPLLVVRNLVKTYPAGPGVVARRAAPVVHAVSDVSFSVLPGTTFGLVGESGCGKTTIGKMIVALEKPQAGQVSLAGRDVSGLRGGELRRTRRDLQLIFQDPQASLDPRMRVGSIVAEPLAIASAGGRKERQDRVRELLAEVGLPPAAVERYPHELSGGQRQRIGLARALTLSPRLIVADEPVSALDLSVRAQVLNLMKRLRVAHGLTYVMISHDLAVIEYMADQIGVMYLGKLVEVGSREDIYSRAAHPYTAALMAAIPIPEPGAERARAAPPIAGELPSAISPPDGCRFRTRCPRAQEVCAEREPLPRSFGPGHLAACHFPLQPPAPAPPASAEPGGAEAGGAEAGGAEAGGAEPARAEPGNV